MNSQPRGVRNRFSALPLISTALEWLAGLAALILLWQRASSQFFIASREIGDSAP